MDNRIKPRIIGGAGTGVASVWTLYSHLNTASDVPSHAGKMLRVLADPPFYLPYVMLLLFVGLVTWAFWPRRQEPEAGTSQGLGQATAGSQSPNIGVNHGVVNFGSPAPAATQPPTQAVSPRTALWNNKSLADLERARAGAGASGPHLNRCPSMPLGRALQHVREVVGNAEEARSQLLQAIAEGRVEIWGKQEIVPSHLSAPISYSDIWSPIRTEYWHDFTLSEAATELETDDPQTEARPHLMKRLMRRYWSLRVDQGQIENEWPKPLSVALPRAPALASKPIPDLPLNGLLVRVYKKLGPAPGRGDPRWPSFLRRVNLEIVDTVKFHDLHVWGRMGDRALDCISETEWSSGKLDHLKGRFVVGSSYSEYEYTDLKFSKAEIDRHWPLEGAE